MNRKAKTPQNTTSLGPVIFIFCFTVIYIVTGYMTLDEDSRHVPLLTAYVTIFLLVLETIKRFMPKLPNAKPEEGAIEEMDVSVFRELTGLAYIVGLALSIYVLGFFIAIPVYIFVAIAYLGKQSKKTAAIVATSASLIIYVVFELLLETRLYQGLFF